MLRGEVGKVGVVMAHVGWRGDRGTAHRRDNSRKEAALEFTAPDNPVIKLGEQGEAN